MYAIGAFEEPEPKKFNIDVITADGVRSWGNITCLERHFPTWHFVDYTGKTVIFSNNCRFIATEVK